MQRPVSFAILGAGLLAFITQFAMVSVAIGDIVDELDAPVRWAGWTLTAFLVTQIVAMSLAGRLTERFGPKPLFVVGIAGFGAASVACALAPTFPVFVAARLIQGFAGGSIMPAGQALLGSLYGEDRRSQVLGLFSSIMPFGAVLGPVLGGIIVETLGWRWTFGVSAPAAVLIVVAGQMFLPSAGERRAVPIDFRGALLLFVLVPALVLALTELGLRDATPDPRLVVGGFATAAVMLVVLLRHELRIEHPILDLEVLRYTPILAANGLSFLFGIAWMGVFALLPFYVQEAYNMAPAESGALVGPRSVVMIIVSSTASLLIMRTGFRFPLAFGLTGVAGSLGLLSLGLVDPTLLGVSIPSFWWLLAVVTSAGFFFGFANPALSTAGVDIAPDRIATIAGSRGMFMMLGGTIGISLVVMAGARASTIAQGFEAMYLVMAVVLVAATVLTRWVPARPGALGDHLPAAARPASRPPATVGREPTSEGALE